WNLIKELNAQDKLTRVQAILAAPTMPKEELYDLNADPYETNNLALRWDHQLTVLRLRGVLEKWIDESHDQGKELEPIDLAARKGATKTNSQPNAGYTLDGQPPSTQTVRPPAQK